MEQIGQPIKDGRISSKNYLLEMTIEEYYNLSKDILDNNEFQRNRIKNSSSVYSLLKEDLKKGCIIPPIVLAIAQNFEDNGDFLSFLQQNQNKLQILDGLQRSYTIRDLVDENKLQDFLQNKIRVEVYVGINKLGVLYRILTLNTGQTRMSTRHQIEIIYSDYIRDGIGSVTLLKETDGTTPQTIGEYKFRDVIEGFTSYLERDYLTIDRMDVLDYIKSLEKLATIDTNNELFENFITSYNSFVDQICNYSQYWKPTNEIEKPFANNACSIFNKSQCLTGYGAAIGKLIDAEILTSIQDIDVVRINTETVIEGLNAIIKYLDYIKKVAKKIGNDQRFYFFYFFRALLNKEKEEYGDIKAAANYAYKQYEREIM